MILAVVLVQVRHCDLLKFSLKLGYRCPDLEQMAEYNPSEALGLAKGTQAMVLVQVQRCDLLKCLLKLGYRCPDLELMDEYNPSEALGAAKENH